MAAILRINHVALVVEDLETALELWRDALGLEVSHVEDMPSQASLIAFLPTGDSEIELVKPTSPDSGIARFMEKRGPGFHHVCLEVDDLDGALTRLKSKGVRLINEEPTTGAGGVRMAFVHPKAAGGVLVELYETKTQEKAPFPVFETERLILRSFTPQDAQAVYDIFSQDKVTKTLDSSTMQTLGEAQERVQWRMELYEKGIGVRWAVALKGNPERLIGSCGYYYPRDGWRNVEIGYELHPDYWGQGLMTEALSALIEYCFRNGYSTPINRIEALTMLDSPASVRVLQKLGFKQEGIRRQYGYWKDAYHNLQGFALLRDEWFAQR